jgi:hypothetical protein
MINPEYHRATRYEKSPPSVPFPWTLDRGSVYQKSYAKANPQFGDRLKHWLRQFTKFNSYIHQVRYKNWRKCGARFDLCARLTNETCSPEYIVQADFEPSSPSNEAVPNYRGRYALNIIPKAQVVHRRCQVSGK